MHDASRILVNNRRLILLRHESSDYMSPAEVPLSEKLTLSRYEVVLKRQNKWLHINPDGRAMRAKRLIAKWVWGEGKRKVQVWVTPRLLGFHRINYLSRGWAVEFLFLRASYRKNISGGRYT